MKKLILFVLIFSMIFVSSVSFAFVSGSVCTNPSDPNCLGAFNPLDNTTTEVQLPDDGILNYTTVNIPPNAIVKFIKNAENTPVYILATGDVTIAGTISVDGGSVESSTSPPGIGGPGGFNGGYGGATGSPGGNGLGPGGGGGGQVGIWNESGGGGFGTAGATGGGGRSTGGAAYGNERLIPLIGGSGGGGNGGFGYATAGGGGGGAILIASSTQITVTGSITANGGIGSDSGGGSGGAIKLMTNIISGDGTISAIGGSGGFYAGSGGAGRIRLEASTITRTASTDPLNSYTNQPGTVPIANLPSLQITSIADNTPVNPTGSYIQPDIILPSGTTNVTINISASNIPVGTSVTVSAIPQNGSVTQASPSPILSGADASSTTASTSINLSANITYVIMAQTTYTLQAKMYWDNEKIEKVKVAATMGKGSEVVYITEKGREIKSSELMAKITGW